MLNSIVHSRQTEGHQMDCEPSLKSGKPESPSLLWLVLPIIGWLIYAILWLRSSSPLKERVTVELKVQPRNGTEAPELVPYPPKVLQGTTQGYDHDATMEANMGALNVKSSLEETLAYLKRDDTYKVDDLYWWALRDRIEPWRNWVEGSQSLSAHFRSELPPLLDEIEGALLQKR